MCTMKEEAREKCNKMYKAFGEPARSQTRDKVNFIAAL